jgi:hypothetical protein
MARMVTYNARSAKPHPETAHLSGIDVLALMRDQELEQIVALNDPATGLSGFVVIHDTTRGPAIGGCRLWSYPTADAALEDAIRLAVAMTRKCALAGLNAGGGKGVLIVDDLVDTGATARVVREMLPKAHFATVYAKPAGRPLVDTFITEVSQDTWIYLPWDMGLQFAPPLVAKG